MIASLLLAVSIVAQEPGYVTSMANHLQRWLAGERIAAQVVARQAMPAALAREKIAFLVGFDTLTTAEIKTLQAFRARGGKLVVFNSGSKALGAMMGVRPVGFRKEAYPGEWSRMDFVAARPAGAPAAIRQTSAALNRAVPIEGQGRVLARWVDRTGRSSGEAAWIASSAGYWMTHLLQADGDEALKARLLGALVGSVVPSLWNAQAAAARESQKSAALRAYAAKQVPRSGEIRAVWDHSGTGLYPGDWPRTMQVLANAHVTDVFVNVAGAGFAHYPSAALPVSWTCRRSGDQLAAALAAAKGRGIRVHAWVLCFTATRGTPEEVAACRTRGWCLKNAAGAYTEYLNPANPAVQGRVLSAIGEIATRYPVQGVHLDFVRWADGVTKPRDAAMAVTRFVAAARQRVKRPMWLTAAVYGKYPHCISSVGQDWGSWVDGGLVDYAVPMDYTNSTAEFAELVARGAATPYRARRIIAGIGVTANESRLDAAKVIDQINVARRYNLAGVSLFDLDVTLQTEILPYLRLGIW